MNKLQIGLSASLLGLGIGLYSPQKANLQSVAQALLIVTPTVFVAHLIHDTQEQALKNKIDNLEKEISYRETVIDFKDNLYAEESEHSSFLSDLTEEREEQLAALELEILDKDAHIAYLNEQIESLKERNLELMQDNANMADFNRAHVTSLNIDLDSLREKVEELEAKVGYKVRDKRDSFRNTRTGQLFGF